LLHSEVAAKIRKFEANECVFWTKVRRKEVEIKVIVVLLGIEMLLCYVAWKGHKLGVKK
jgi:hypothetical protein